MTDEYFVHIEKLQRQEEDARRQKEQIYVQMQTAYENLKRDNAQQNRQIIEMQKHIQEAEMKANLLSQENMTLKDVENFLTNRYTEMDTKLAKDLNLRDETPSETWEKLKEKYGNK